MGYDVAITPLVINNPYILIPTEFKEGSSIHSISGKYVLLPLSEGSEEEIVQYRKELNELVNKHFSGGSVKLTKGVEELRKI